MLTLKTVLKLKRGTKIKRTRNSEWGIRVGIMAGQIYTFSGINNTMGLLLEEFGSVGFSFSYFELIKPEIKTHLPDFL